MSYCDWHKLSLKSCQDFDLLAPNKYEYDRIGLNGRLDTIQAAVLLEKLKIFNVELQKRQKIANNYIKKFKTLKTNIILPAVLSYVKSSWAQFTIKLPPNLNRKDFQTKMKERNIPTAIYYPIPIHFQKPYKKYPISTDNLKNTIKLSECVISLPMHPYLSEKDIEYISQTVHQITNI